MVFLLGKLTKFTNLVIMPILETTTQMFPILRIGTNGQSKMQKLVMCLRVKVGGLAFSKH